MTGDEQFAGRTLCRDNRVIIVEPTTEQRATIDRLLDRVRAVLEDLPDRAGLLSFAEVKALVSGMFPDVGGGVRRNAETGVEIVTLDLFGTPTGDYEVRRPALHDHGYEVVLTAESLGEAVDEACAQVYSMQQVIDHDRREADKREAFAMLHGRDPHRRFPRRA